MRVQFTRLLTAACVLLVPLGAGAQEIPSSFNELRVLVKPGDTVTVTDEAGQEVRGRILELSSTSLALMTNNRRRDLTVDEIQRVTRSQHGDAGVGAKWGAAVGAGAGVLLVSLNSPAGRCSDCGQYMVVFGLTFGGIGAGIGAATAAATTHQQLIFNKAGTPLKLAVAPLVSRERQGVLVSLRY